MLETQTVDLLVDLGLEELKENATIQQLVAGDSRYLRDARMNLSGLKRVKELNAKEQMLMATAIANNNNNEVLQKAFSAKARTEGATEEELAEALACASLLSANNVLYRFRHFMESEKESYQRMPAGLRMNIMSNPVLGKEYFELLSLAISAVNGCELCVKSHEQSLIDLGTSEKRVFASIRMAAVVTSLCKVIY
jgi:alkyl hydroperoxide reductase subunit D